MWVFSPKLSIQPKGKKNPLRPALFSLRFIFYKIEESLPHTHCPLISDPSGKFTDGGGSEC